MKTSSRGVNLRKVRRRMGMVFQNINLFAHLTVVENVMRAPVPLLGISRREAYQDALRLLDMVGLFEKALAYPHELSGGQQRAAIVRALALEQRVAIDGLVIHHVDSAGVLMNGLYAEVDGPFCAKPKSTTGAGDHFNAGFVYGLLLDCPLDQVLLLGVAPSGYYVRTAASPSPDELADFIGRWLARDV